VGHQRQVKDEVMEETHHMLAVSAVIPQHNTEHPSVILVHGAANAAPVWTFWQQALATHGWASYAIDLRGHGRSAAVDLSHISMHDYVADVQALALQLKRPPVVMGWSMGGLVAMMAAADGGVAACVALAPSLPARQRDPSVALRPGEFGPEEYGIHHRRPDDQPAMPDLDREERLIALGSLGKESRPARNERQAGVIVESMPSPLLIVTGSADTQWPRARYQGLWLTAEYLSAEGASHWGLVLNRRALATTIPAVLRWLASAVHKPSAAEGG
jgi:pimeloyl-ACP methyl ester carboxylesterase